MTSESWEVASDADEVHAFLLANDRAAARPGAPAPSRNPDSTRRHVAERRVHLLCRDGIALGMFTLGPKPPFDPAAAGYGAAASPLYLQRLAVAPAASKSLAGLKLLRRAITLAREEGADVVRAETNPRLIEACALLSAAGFVPIAPSTDSDASVRYVELRLR